MIKIKCLIQQLGWITCRCLFLCLYPANNYHFLFCVCVLFSCIHILQLHASMLLFSTLGDLAHVGYQFSICILITDHLHVVVYKR